MTLGLASGTTLLSLHSQSWELRPCHTMRWNGPFLCDSELQKHRRLWQNIASFSRKIAAVWPVCYSQWNVSALSYNVHSCNGNKKYLTENFESHIIRKLIKCWLSCWKLFENQTILIKVAEIFQNQAQHYRHVGKCIAAHHMRFWCIAGGLERPIASVQHRNVWLGLYSVHGLGISKLKSGPLNLKTTFSL